MQISLNGIAFTPYDAKAKNNSKEKLKNEIVSFSENINKTNQNISYQTKNKLSENSVNTIFKNRTTNEKLVTISLENR